MAGTENSTTQPNGTASVRYRIEVMARHLARLARRIALLEAQSRRYSRIRLVLFLFGVAALTLALQVGTALAAWAVLAVFIAAFALVAAGHRRVEAGLERLRLWLQIKTAHHARLTLDWERLPAPLDAAADATHPFAADLDVTGPASLHHFLDTTGSEGGSRRLRAWLTDPVLDPAHIEAQQAHVQELVRASRFRDRLALAARLVGGRRASARWSDAPLQRWLERDGEAAALRPWLLGLGGLAAANVVLFSLFVFADVPALWAVSLALYLALYVGRARSLRPLFAEADALAHTLQQLGAVLLFLEQADLRQHPRVAHLCAVFRESSRPPSRYLREGRRIAAGAGFQQSELVAAVLNLLVPWKLFLTYRLARLKEQVRHQLPRWLDRLYTLEALSALAHFADSNPETTFPEIQQEPGSPLLTARRLGHPLIPAPAKVRNDFEIERLGTVALVTGSNMSGKSTFLRTLGLNLCLAYAGGPVDASGLRVVPFRLFTCLRVDDSVQDGLSYFYAEVRRLAALMNALETPFPAPLFYLIDEIFRATNNRERLVGAAAYIRALAGKPGAGLVATHDLELTRLADEIHGLRNYHFREEVTAGRMHFDYRLRPGPSQTTNALKIMRLEGLPVPPP